jgi:hypothetical protein
MKKQVHLKHFCIACLYSGKGAKSTCPKCNSELKQISHKFHLPSMKASKTKWKKFIKESQFVTTGTWTTEELHKFLESVNN